MPNGRIPSRRQLAWGPAPTCWRATAQSPAPHPSPRGRGRCSRRNPSGGVELVCNGFKTGAEADFCNGASAARSGGLPAWVSERAACKGRERSSSHSKTPPKCAPSPPLPAPCSSLPPSSSTPPRPRSRAPRPRQPTSQRRMFAAPSTPISLLRALRLLRPLTDTAGAAQEEVEAADRHHLHPRCLRHQGALACAAPPSASPDRVFL